MCVRVLRACGVCLVQVDGRPFVGVGFLSRLVHLRRERREINRIVLRVSPYRIHIPGEKRCQFPPIGSSKIEETLSLVCKCALCSIAGG